MGLSPALQNGLAVADPSIPGKRVLVGEVVVVNPGTVIKPTRLLKVSVVPDRSPRRNACLSLTQVPVRQLSGEVAPTSAKRVPHELTRFWRTRLEQLIRTGLRTL